MTAEALERSINKHLQKEISFLLNHKTLKTGKLILFCIKDFYLVFTLSVGNSKKIFELPYPFSYKVTPHKIILDYTLKTFTHNVPEIINLSKLLVHKKPNKLYNNITEIVEILK